MAKFKLFEPLKPKAPPPNRKVHFSGRDKPPIFGQLFPFSWRGKEYPITTCKVTIAQDLAEHRYWGEAAAHIEATGRAPFEIEAEIPFVNGIFPGKNERWGVLYPTAFGQFVQDALDNSTGLLDTPELAGIACKLRSAEYSHDAQRRDGVIVTARWVETVDPDVQSDVPLVNEATAQLAALSLDDHVATIVRDFPEEFEPSTETFESLLNKVSGVVDTTASKLSLLLNKPAQMMYRVNKVRESVERARNVLLWPLVDAADKMAEVTGAPSKSGAGDTLFGTDKKPGRQVSRYVVQSRTSLDRLLQLFPTNTIDDLIFLNARLISRPTIPAKSVVRYYL